MKTYYDQRSQHWVVEHKISVGVPDTILSTMSKAERKQLIAKIEQKLKRYCDAFAPTEGAKID